MEATYSNCFLRESRNCGALMHVRIVQRHDGNNLSSLHVFPGLDTNSQFL